VIADCNAPTGSKERDLAYQVSQVWCDGEDITEDCYMFDTDANIAMCYERNAEGSRFRYPGENEVAKIIKIGQIRYSLRKGESRTFEQSLRDNVEAVYDSATGQIVTVPTMKITTEEVTTVTRDPEKRINVDRILVDTAKDILEQSYADGYVSDKVFPPVPVDDPKEPDAYTSTVTGFWDADSAMTYTVAEVSDKTVVTGDVTFTLTWPDKTTAQGTYEYRPILKWWRDEDEKNEFEQKYKTGRQWITYTNVVS
jgi:hypothetical protein